MYWLRTRHAKGGLGACLLSWQLGEWEREKGCKLCATWNGRANRPGLLTTVKAALRPCTRAAMARHHLPAGFCIHGNPRKTQKTEKG